MVGVADACCCGSVSVGKVLLLALLTWSGSGGGGRFAEGAARTAGCGALVGTWLVILGGGAFM